MNDLAHHIYEVDELVIGNNLEAISYCYLNEKPIVLNSDKKPYFFDFFEKGSCLEKYMIESVGYELKSLNDKKIVGPSALEVWERLVFYLSLAGLVPLADKVFSIRVEEDNFLKIATKDSRVVRIKFNKLRIFDTENVSGLVTREDSDMFKVVDWVNVRSGMKHKYDHFETEDDFVKEVYFYPSHRLGSGENDDRKDLVSISYLTKEQLNDFKYSDTYVKFKILNLMKEAGIRGPRNGRRYDDPSKHAYLSIKIEPFSREIRASEKLKYDVKDSFIFDDRTERDIYRSCLSKKNYLHKISKNL